MLVNQYVVPLPDSQADALTFQQVAREWAQQPHIPPFPSDVSYTISWVISILYRLVGVDVLLAHALSVLLGTLTVVLGSLLTLQLWGSRHLAQRAGWVLALFPTLLLYSALTMREAYIWFFLSLTLLGVALSARSGSLTRVLLVLTGVVGATLYHGAMIVAGLTFAIMLMFSRILRTIQLLLRARLELRALLILSIALFVLVFTIALRLPLPKIGPLLEVVSAETLTAASMYAFRGGAAYPEWLLPATPAEVVTKLPARVVYFLFSPFLWDVRSAHQAVGLLDSILYIYLAWLCWRGRHRIWKNAAARWIAGITAALIVTFALGVGNFGTGIRHRAKVVVPLVALSVAGAMTNRRVATLHRNEPSSGMAYATSQAG